MRTKASVFVNSIGNTYCYVPESKHSSLTFKFKEFSEVIILQALKIPDISPTLHGTNTQVAVTQFVHNGIVNIHVG